MRAVALPAMLVVVALLLRPASLLADAANDEARRHYETGSRRYAVGDYDQAIEEFKRAYTLSMAPGLLFNLAQAYRASKDPARALFFYESYLREGSQGPERAFAQARARELRERREREPASGGGADARLGWGLATAGAGVLLLGTGVFFGARAASATGDLSGDPGHGGAWSDDKADALRRDTIVSAVTTTAGAAAVITGGVLAYLALRDQRRARDRSSLAVSAFPISGGAAVSLGGEF